MTTSWTPSDTKHAKYIGIIEFQDTKDEWHEFETLRTKDRVIFGGMCNVGFIESGYIEREDGEALDKTLQEMLADLECYYNDGPYCVSRIVCNDRM